MHHGEFRPGINPFDNGKGISTFRIAVLTILGTLLLFTGISASSDAATRNVAVGGAVSGSCTGTPCDLNWAISVADPADTVSLANGTYNLGNIQVPKELHFVGASRAGTIVGLTSGSPAVDTFELNDTADGSSFSTMTITGRDGGKSAIGTTTAATSVDDIDITNVSVTSTKWGGGNAAIGITAPASGWTLDDVLTGQPAPMIR